MGRSEFTAGPTFGDLIDQWLLETLEPFSLPPDLLNRLGQSVREVVSRLMTCSDFFSVDVRVHISQDVKSAGTSNRNWGYFKLEKTGFINNEESPVAHVLEYYLYFER